MIHVILRFGLRYQRINKLIVSYVIANVK